MAIESPLFQSSMELLGHSFSHYNGGKELDRKLVILHLANAVELILKDLVLDVDESIYKGPKETISIYKCLDIIEKNGINLPYLNKLELLTDERNSLQHRFGSPNEMTTIFYINIAIDFFKEVLDEIYNIDYDEIIVNYTNDKDLLAFKLKTSETSDELEILEELSTFHPLGALLSATTYLENIIREFINSIDLSKENKKALFHNISHRTLVKYGIEIPDDLSDKISSITKLKNSSSVGNHIPNKREVKDSINTIREFESYLESIDITEAHDQVEEKIKEIDEKNTPKRKKRTNTMKILFDNSLIKEGDKLYLKNSLPSYVNFEEGNNYFIAEITGKRGKSNTVRWLFDDSEHSISALAWQIFKDNHPDGKNPGGVNGNWHWTNEEGKPLWVIAESFINSEKI